MAQITRTPLVRHLRSEPGLAFWFRPLSTGVAEVPLDDRDLRSSSTGVRPTSRT